MPCFPLPYAGAVSTCAGRTRPATIARGRGPHTHPVRVDVLKRPCGCAASVRWRPRWPRAQHRDFSGTGIRSTAASELERVRAVGEGLPWRAAFHRGESRPSALRPSSAISAPHAASGKCFQFLPQLSTLMSSIIDEGTAPSRCHYTSTSEIAGTPRSSSQMAAWKASTRYSAAYTGLRAVTRKAENSSTTEQIEQTGLDVHGIVRAPAQRYLASAAVRCNFFS